MYGTASAAKHDYVRRLGVTPIDYRNEDFVAVAVQLKGGGFDVIFDTELNFTVTSASSTPAYFVVFDEVYTSDQGFNNPITTSTTSTMTLPGRMPATMSAVRMRGAGRPKTCAVLITMSA